MEENQLHPELARQTGAEVQRKTYDVHPALQAEVDAAEEIAAAQEQPQQEAAEVASVEQEVNPTPAVDKLSAVQETPKDRNWREMRQQAERAKQLEREAEVLARERDFYRQQAEKQSKPEEEDYRTEYEKKFAREMEELRQQVSRQEKETTQAKQQAAISRAEQRLAQDYPDIRDVVSDENIHRLELEYPHLYNSVIASTDVYTVGSAAYEMIMAKGIYKKPANTLSQLASQNQAARNQSKPKSASTVAPQSGETPITRAGNFMGNSISSEDERKALYAEMISSARNKTW